MMNGFIPAPALASDTHGSGKTKNSRKHRRNEEERVAEDVSKLLRTGSISRILASSNSAEGGGGINGNREVVVVGLPLTPSEVVKEIVDAFNFSDLSHLSEIVRNTCRRDCVLTTTALPNPVVGRNYIMMYWALIMEAFPDGVWVRRGPAAVEKSAITQHFLFSGIRIFHRPTVDLFEYVIFQSERIPKADPSKSSHDIDALGEILQGCWISSNKLSPAVTSTITTGAGAVVVNGGTGTSSHGGSSSHGSNLKGITSTAASSAAVTPGATTPKLTNQERKMKFTFDTTGKLARIDCIGDV
jgi:hypothetical protein